MGEKLFFRGHVISARQIGARTSIARFARRCLARCRRAAAPRAKRAARLLPPCFQRENGPQRQAMLVRVRVLGWVRVMVEFGTSSAFRGWVRVRVLGYGFGVSGRNLSHVETKIYSILGAFCLRQNAQRAALRAAGQATSGKQKLKSKVT